MNVARGNWS